MTYGEIFFLVLKRFGGFPPSTDVEDVLVNYCVQVGNYVVNQHKIVTRNNNEIVRRNAARPESHPSEKFLVVTNMRVSVSSINF